MADRPNIIFINTDQQRYETINALGFDYVDTPNLDRLVNEGVNFSRCFVNSPVCGPTSASRFSGLSPHNSGALHNGSRWNDSWVTLLNDAGYHCVNVGKMHTGPMDAPWGFHERYVVENKDRSAMPVKFLDELDKAILAHRLEKPGGASYARDFPDYEEREGAYEWPLPAHLHPDVFVGETAVRWLDLTYDKYPIDKPLFLEIGFTHPTTRCPSTWTSTWNANTRFCRSRRKIWARSRAACRGFARGTAIGTSTRFPSIPTPQWRISTVSGPTTWRIWR